MTLALDTDVLVQFTMAGALHHARVAALIAEQRRIGAIALTTGVLHEWLHVTTDARRFARPLAMEDAIPFAADLWNATDVVRIVPGPRALNRTLELMAKHALGRKRILDTAYAAALEEAGVTRLATLNGGDYRIFGFLEIIDPR